MRGTERVSVRTSARFAARDARELREAGWRVRVWVDGRGARIEASRKAVAR